MVYTNFQQNLKFYDKLMDMENIQLKKWLFVEK